MLLFPFVKTKVIFPQDADDTMRNAISLFKKHICIGDIWSMDNSADTDIVVTTKEGNPPKE